VDEVLVMAKSFSPHYFRNADFFPQFHGSSAEVATTKIELFVLSRKGKIDDKVGDFMRTDPVAVIPDNMSLTSAT